MPSAHSIIVIQSICTIWSKASRGGSDATARNHTPTALELPTLNSSPHDTHLVVHKILYFERNGFQDPIEELEQKEPAQIMRYNCLNIAHKENILNVSIEWEHSEGVPRRPSYPRKGFSLQENQWGRIIYNLRSSNGYWIYKKYILNIGFFVSSSPEVFLETKPTHTHTDMAQLR